MSSDGTTAIAIIVIGFAIAAVDQVIRRRALRGNSAWVCYRCRADINPFDGSRDIRIAGVGPYTFVRVCERCGASWMASMSFRASR